MREKVDPALLAEMEGAPSVQPEKKIGVLVRTKKKIDEIEKKEIEKRGGEIGSVIGDVASLQLPIEAVPSIAALDFVISIEKAKKQRLR
jgi:hypothetical protein